MIRRRLWILPIAVVVLIVAAAVTVIMVWPPVAALACPQCYGLQRISDDVYAERDLSADQRDRITAATTEARQRIVNAYGPDSGSPRILACITADCYRRIGGGGEAGVAIMNRGLMLSPRGVNPVIAAHELSHVEFRRRAGGAAVPQWFDEGLAVVVSDDLRYLVPEGSPDRADRGCRAEPGGPLPDTLDDWLATASADEQVYARAACAVDRWIDTHGGLTAVPALAQRLAGGETFAVATR